MSAIYASNLGIDKFIEAFNKDDQALTNLLNDAQVIHCQPWETAIDDVLQISSMHSSNIDYRQSKISRQWVFDNISPTLLTKLHTNNVITNNDILKALKTK